MKTQTFYQLLDRELPRAIDGASKLLSVSKQCSLALSPMGNSFNEFQGSIEGEKKREPSLQEIYPMVEGRCGVTSGSRIQKLTTVRDALGELSLAFAISKHRPFANVAERLVVEEILGCGLLAGEDWTEGFSLSQMGENESEIRTLIVEIVLGIEMLRSMGKIKKGQLTELKAVLAKRLSALEKKSVSRLTTADKFSWLLERLVIALYLDDREAFDKIRYLVESRYSASFVRLFEAEMTMEKDEMLFCIDCYFALSYWLDQGGAQSSRFVEKAFSQLDRGLSERDLDKLQRGAWVLAHQTSFADELLRESSVLLILGAGLDQPEMIDSWMERLAGPSQEKATESAVITRPLIWFGSEEWGYRPFRLKTSKLGAFVDRA